MNPKQTPEHTVSPLRITAVQMQFASTIDENIKKIASSVQQAKQDQADIVLFPECATTGYNLDFSSLQIEPLHAALHQLGKLAATHQINLLIGSPLFSQGKLYNALIAFDRKGTPVHAYAKCQLTPADQAHFTPGNALAFFHLDGIAMTCIICHERRYPELVRIPVMAGAKIIFHPNAGLDQRSVSLQKHHGKDGIAVRAFENAVPYVFSNSVGPQGDHLWSAGDSKIVAASGKILAQADNHNEKIITATLDMNTASGKYALDSLQHPHFLRQHWHNIIADSKKQAQSESRKLLKAIF